ncbi:NADPH-dependent FMN reductase [Cohaesibacter gelatinilyticus]|uniref:NAD(P)H-dependent FMN reductase n=1 Tax=Cohaesibacter gelatinilyticus TaxID=372072 RepID=A0A285PIH2_9HYPH|nr:NAD(P)H-dependent oxidoreductase [Cohaesibacter gelatinilyticus]SNZ19926.1 NAD(P)H-dependent FMN reductase [Cohaesibacter gelatinilyticus]
MTHSKILCFAGSNRSASFNKSLAGAMAKQLSLLDCEVTLISLQDYPLPLFDQDEEAEKGIPENAIKLAKLLASQDGVFIASPEYNASISPLLKNTIDWISRLPNSDPHPFKNPVYAIGGASPGGLGGIRGLAHLRQVLVALGALVLPQQVSVGSAHSAFDDTGDLSDNRTAAFLGDAAASLLSHSKRF